MCDIKSFCMTRGWLVLVPVLMIACGGGVPPVSESEMVSESPVSEPSPAAAVPRVFFVSPEDGGTYAADSPVPFEFGVERYGLAAVPEEVEQPRLGMGHHHLGVNIDCLATGELIPRDDPSWVHFGDASSTIEMMLEPGEHMFVLQLGDDEHRTQAEDGLCARVTFRVEEGI